jgi:hypothetical protein
LEKIADGAARFFSRGPRDVTGWSVVASRRGGRSNARPTPPLLARLGITLLDETCKSRPGSGGRTWRPRIASQNARVLEINGYNEAEEKTGFKRDALMVFGRRVLSMSCSAEIAPNLPSDAWRIFLRFQSVAGGRTRARTWDPARLPTADPETFAMVDDRWSDGSRPSTVGAKMLPSRDHRDLIDGSSSHDGFRSGWMAAMAALAISGRHHPFRIDARLSRFGARHAFTANCSS